MSRKTKRVPLADVLWDAANRFLSPHNRTQRYFDDFYTCNAVCYAVSRSYVPAWDQILDFVSDLGCEVSGFSQFKDFPSGIERQGVRYIWLLLAMHVAEDEGVMVEVSQ